MRFVKPTRRRRFARVFLRHDFAPRYESEPPCPALFSKSTVIPKRMLTVAESAHHCGRSLTRFKIECPVHPVRFPNSDVRYDVQDLDGWLTSLKAGAGDHDADAIVARLGA